MNAVATTECTSLSISRQQGQKEGCLCNHSLVVAS